MRFRPIRKRHAFAAAVVVVLLAGSVAYATIPDSNGVLTACMQKTTGGLRLIDPAASKGPLSRCNPAETEVTWNHGGPTGPQGPPGAKGPTGDKGPVGDKGQTGDKGPTGDKGLAGDKGLVGDKGPNGDKGLPGDKGPVGDKGQTGDKGLPGDKGPPGNQGPPGLPGQSQGPKIIRGGTYGGVNGLGVYAGTGFTVTTNSPGNYTITFPAGTWSCYPIATFQGFFRPATPDIQFASNDGLTWTVDWGGQDTTFDFIFVDSC